MNRSVAKNSMPALTRTDLVKILSRKQEHLAQKDVELAVRSMINMMTTSLSSGERIEIRGFGSFNLHYRSPHTGRNPRTGEPLNFSGKYVPYFKPGKDLRKRIL